MWSFRSFCRTWLNFCRSAGAYWLAKPLVALSATKIFSLNSCGPSSCETMCLTCFSIVCHSITLALIRSETGLFCLGFCIRRSTSRIWSLLGDSLSMSTLGTSIVFSISKLAKTKTATPNPKRSRKQAAC